MRLEGFCNDFLVEFKLSLKFQIIFPEVKISLFSLIVSKDKFEMLFSIDSRDLSQW